MCVGQSSEDSRVDREDTATRVQTTLKGAMGERVTKALQKVEDKKKKRAARREQVGAACDASETCARQEKSKHVCRFSRYECRI